MSSFNNFSFTDFNYFYPGFAQYSSIQRHKCFPYLNYSAFLAKVIRARSILVFHLTFNRSKINSTGANFGLDVRKNVTCSPWSRIISVVKLDLCVGVLSGRCSAFLTVFLSIQSKIFAMNDKNTQNILESTFLCLTKINQWPAWKIASISVVLLMLKLYKIGAFVPFGIHEYVGCKDLSKLHSSMLMNCRFSFIVFTIINSK